MTVPAGLPLDELPTPALLLDLDVLEANLSRMQAKAERLGVRLRPHAKTHKSLDVADLQYELGAAGLTVSTLAEARFFVSAGFSDVTWAYPLVLSRLDEARRLVEAQLMMDEDVTLRLTIDSLEALDALLGQATPFHVFVKVDCGYGRAGVDPEGELARTLVRRLDSAPHLHFDGLLSHSGHAYAATSAAGAGTAAAEERRVVVELAERLRADGVEVPTVSVGSTPGMAAVEDLAGVDEARPGNYCFYDGTQAALGSCGWSDCALTVSTSVVSCQPGAGHAVVDAGALALSKDSGPEHLGSGWRWGMGAVFTDLAAYRSGRPDPELHLTSLSQEHGKISGPLPVGTLLRVVPNHSCLAVPCFGRYWVVRGEEVVGRWGIFQDRE